MKEDGTSIRQITVIVPGGLHTDIIGAGVSDIVGKGELSYGGSLRIGPGGKSRNIAEMISVLSGRDGRVAMVGRTSRDPYGLWKPPLDALESAGVNTDHVRITDFEETGKYSAIALIPVDRDGRNQIYVLPGINEDFSPDDVDTSRDIFESAGKQGGILALSLELPLPTAIRSIELAREYGLRTVLDPGGIRRDEDYEPLLSSGIFLLKPNEHEAEILSGVVVTNFESAREAAGILLGKGIEYVLITAGGDGAYLFGEDIDEHIPASDPPKTGERDETGCGDQTMATLCMYLSEGMDVVEASRIAIRAGTIQFSRSGIRPVEREELHETAKNVIQ